MEGFNDNIKKAADGIVASTLRFYNTIKQEPLTNPLKIPLSVQPSIS